MMLGLPDDVRALLFDLDGVLATTAVLHERAWKSMFDEFLRQRAERLGQGFEQFTSQDYLDYVDGRPRLDGVRAFLEHRGITLPEGTPADGPDAETMNGLGNRKNDLVLKLIDEGVHAYPDAVALLEAAKQAEYSMAVVSSSANAGHVLDVIGLAGYFEHVVDGNYVAENNLRGKPAPDGYLAGAELLDSTAAQSAIFEDAISGVAAGHAGGFKAVVGVDRDGGGHRNAMQDAGATIVVAKLDELISEER